jgi:hypothetical protein
LGRLAPGIAERVGYSVEGLLAVVATVGRKEQGKKKEEFISRGVMFAFQDIREKLA